MTDESDEEELSAALARRAVEQLSCQFFSATLYIRPGTFYADLGWPPLPEEWRGAVGPLSWSAVGRYHVTFDRQWMAIAVSMSARVELDLGIFKASMTVTMGFNADRSFSEPDERGLVSPVWTFSLHSHGSMSVEIAGIRFSSSWSYGCRGVSTYGPPLLSTAPPLLLLPFVRD